MILFPKEHFKNQNMTTLPFPKTVSDVPTLGAIRSALGMVVTSRLHHGNNHRCCLEATDASDDDRAVAYDHTVMDPSARAIATTGKESYGATDMPTMMGAVLLLDAPSATKLADHDSRGELS